MIAPAPEARRPRLSPVAEPVELDWEARTPGWEWEEEAGCWAGTFSAVPEARAEIKRHGPTGLWEATLRDWAEQTARSLNEDPVEALYQALQSACDAALRSLSSAP